jgi:hypothetical protein
VALAPVVDERQPEPVLRTARREAQDCLAAEFASDQTSNQREPDPSASVRGNGIIDAFAGPL